MVEDKLGRASGDVTVRDPVVLTATLPRFMLSGDRSAMQLELDNVEGAAGDYRISVQSDGPVRLGAGAPETLRLRGAAARPRVGAAHGVSGRDRQYQGADRGTRTTSRSTATTRWRQSRRTRSSRAAPSAPSRPAKA